MAPSKDCMTHCLDQNAPCRKYVSCRPPTPSEFICDDGEWPEANSGCCVNEATGIIGCPRLCESERIWRLDRREGIPWWARWQRGRGMVAQCTCAGCPSTEANAQEKLIKSVEEGLWDNGQIILVDIARREGLKFGPNRRMQELMATRNTKITEMIKKTDIKSSELDRRIAGINARYSQEITRAARKWGDSQPQLPDWSPQQDVEDVEEKKHPEYIVVPIVCTVLLIIVICWGCACLRAGRRKRDEIIAFESAMRQGSHVVIGQPVFGTSDAVHGEIQGGMACGMPVVTSVVTAHVKSPKGQDAGCGSGSPTNAWCAK